MARKAKSPKEGLEQTLVFGAKEILPVLSDAIDELKTKRTKESKERLQRFQKWQRVLEEWQEDEIPSSLKLTRLEELRDFLVWDRENYG